MRLRLESRIFDRNKLRREGKAAWRCAGQSAKLVKAQLDILAPKVRQTKSDNGKDATVENFVNHQIF